MPESSSTAFNPEFISTLPRWFGRVVSSATWQDNIIPHTFSNPNEIKGWGFRYKVRIFSWNTGDPGVVPDEHLLMANVVLPVTAGSGHGGYFETPAIAAGSVVTGFFLDGEGGQEPYIDGILPNTNGNNIPKKQGTGPLAGYQQFNDTFGPKALVPDFLTEKNTQPIQKSDETSHRDTKASEINNTDKYRRKPLASTRKCKKNNSEMKGIQLTIKNMINDVEEAKKKLTKAQGFIGEVNRVTAEVSQYTTIASQEIASFMKTIMGGVRGYVLKKIKAGVQDVAPFLFPTDVSELQNKLSKSLNGLSCGFAKIINGLQKTFEGLLDSILGKFINAPMCAAENIVSKLVDGVLGQITSLIDSVVGPLAAFITGLTGKAMNLIGSAFNALNMVMGILTFFQCDEEPSCAEYDNINQARNPSDGEEDAQSSDGTAARTTKNTEELQPTQSEVDAERANSVTDADAINDRSNTDVDRSLEATLAREDAAVEAALAKEQQQAPEEQIRNNSTVTDPKTKTNDQEESEKARRLLGGEKVDGVEFELAGGGGDSTSTASSISQRHTVDRAFSKVASGDVAIIPGGVPVNRDLTADELSNLDSEYRYVANTDGSAGGRIVKRVGQNYG